MLCAGSANKTLRTDACQGDSGGPLVQKMEQTDEFSYWVQVGIVSWGYKCGTIHPGFYVSVPSIMPWIWSVIDKNRIGKWKPWTTWTECTKSCGEGQRHRVRICDGQNCEGGNFEATKCKKRECSWDNWGDWTTCTRTCQAGTQKRERTCRGENCQGKSTEVRECNNVACPDVVQCSSVPPPQDGSIKVVPDNRFFSVGTTVFFICNKGKYLKDGPSSITCLESGKWSDTGRPSCADEWSPWSSWSDCTATCDGVRWKARTCQKGGGTLGKVLGCPGDALVYSKCNTGICQSSESCDFVNHFGCFKHAILFQTGIALVILQYV